ncbi:galactosyldiacylglycerol synthase [Bacillus sp. RG28]|uniref:Galactosyldiacylglycerol synthase n=1 Tax=Gottfriedia endophytica TaxID=2820819 RepID=A0A940NX90_9BACI|nr:glycosyltransferase [Gottfriedia endophytica]MBP0726688.1 galactosyldiacylglycerol synthase [Gottfriedia endophytica]
MNKILFFPLFRMQSGHHQVADTLIDMLNKQTNDIELKKIDLLSYTNVSLEKMITSSYLNWIRFAPETYNFVYKNFFYDSSKENAFKWYQRIFQKKMEQLLAIEKPDLIICTHGFPSNILSQLKRKGKCNIPVINVYTDYFINNVWGLDGIDLHFLPSQEVKESLIGKSKISKQNMFVTGIPVHGEITDNSRIRKNCVRPKILVSGGNSGLGRIQKLSDELKKSTHLDFLVLCGKNKKLYNEIISWNVDHVTPIPYLSSRSEMNAIYEEVDAIITKPGGVTISEALHKSLPIFVHSALPGQEEINLKYLKNKGLIFNLDIKKSIEQQLISVLNDKVQIDRWKKSLISYKKGLELQNPEKMVEVIMSLLSYKLNLSSRA